MKIFVFEFWEFKNGNYFMTVDLSSCSQICVFKNYLFKLIVSSLI